MWRAFPASDYYEGSVNRWCIGAALPSHHHRLSPVHMLGLQTHRGGCLSQSLPLLSASRDLLPRSVTHDLWTQA